MKLEKLEDNTSKVKGVIIGILLTIGLVILINYITSLARYRNTESIELASGNISYNKADLNIIAMYQESSYGTNGYKQIDDVPTEKYTLSNKSYCEVNKEPIEDAQIEYREGAIYVGNIKKRGTKCYVYFDMDYTSDDMLAKLEAIKQSTYEKTAMPSPITGPYDEQKENPEHKEKLYTTEDNYGTSYVFRGNNSDVHNWVTFANHTWRIIRINGDGTLRMIFQCAEPNCTDTTGEKTQIGKNAYKIGQSSDNTYVGYYYGEAGQDTYEATHTNVTPSTVAQAVDDWYTGIGAMTNYTKYLSGDTGFCNDRVIVKEIWSTRNGDGYGKIESSYSSASRLMPKGGGWRKNQYPTLKCGVVMPKTDPTEEEGFSSFDEIDPIALKRDLFTLEKSSQGNGKLSVPAALITSDEVAMSGGFAGTAGTNYWLYTNQYYWTMSPSHYYSNGGYSLVHLVHDDGKIATSAGVNWTGGGIRPVINLNADIEFSGGTGKSDNPFVVNTSM